LNGIDVKTKNTIINYNCPTCQKECSILLKKFLLKKTLNCRSCKEDLPGKKKNQSEYLKKSFEKFGKISPLIKEDNKRPNKDKIIFSNFNFNNETIDFQKKYFEKHLTSDQFDKIKHLIYSVNGFKDISESQLKIIVIDLFKKFYNNLLSV
jgi:hypothetical protein